jgi:hypothetical protein
VTDVQTKVILDLTRTCLMKAAELLIMTIYLGPDGSWSCVGICAPCTACFHMSPTPHSLLLMVKSGVSCDNDKSVLDLMRSCPTCSALAIESGWMNSC